MNGSFEAAPGPTGPQRLPVCFVGSGSEYFRIWIVNLLLTMVTFGLYYPFAKVRRLRYFHGCTEVGGHAMAFHGNPWAMFRGHLLVVVLLGGYSLAQQMHPALAFGSLAVLAIVWPLLWQASMRFRLANTGWRGLRLRFTGTRKGAYGALLPFFGVGIGFGVVFGLLTYAAGPKSGLPLLAVLLLPAVVPWLMWRMKRYQHDHFRYAGEQSRFGVPLAAQYGVYLRGLALALLVLVLMLGGTVAMGLTVALDAKNRLPPGVAYVGLVVFFAGFLALQVLVRAYFAARLQNLHWGGTRSEHLHFESQLAFTPLAWLTLRNWLLMMVTLGLYFPFAAVATAKLRLEAVTLVAATDLDTLVATEATEQGSAAGDAAIDALGFDIGL